MAKRKVSNFARAGFPSYEEIDEEGQARNAVYGVSWVNPDTLKTLKRRGSRPTGPKGEPVDPKDFRRR